MFDDDEEKPEPETDEPNEAHPPVAVGNSCPKCGWKHGDLEPHPAA